MMNAKRFTYDQRMNRQSGLRQIRGEHHETAFGTVLAVSLGCTFLAAVATLAVTDAIYR